MYVHIAGANTQSKEELAVQRSGERYYFLFFTCFGMNSRNTWPVTNHT